MLTISLPPEIEARLKGDAALNGMDAAAYAIKLIEAALLPESGVDQATIDLLDKWARDNDTEDPEEIARRQVEFEEFKEAMNRNRLESEGPDARKIYP